MKFLYILKPLALTLGLLLVVSFVNGAARVASVTGNWSNTTTWGGAAVPTSADNVTINSGITVTVNATATCLSMTNNGILTATTFGITVAGVWVNNGTFNAGAGKVTFSGASAAINAGTGTANFNIIAPALATTTLAINTNTTCSALTYGASTATTVVSIATGYSLTVSGAVTIPRASTMNRLAVGAGTLNAGSIAFTNGGGNVRHQITISTGTVAISGDITTDNTGASASIIFSGAGTLNAGVGIMTTTTSGGTLTTFAGCTVNYNGTVTQTVKDVAYLGNLTLSGSGVKTWTLTANRTIPGILTINSGANFTTVGNFTFGVTGATNISGTITLGGTSAKTFTGNVTINSGGVWSETGIAAINYAGNLQNDGTTFTALSGVHTFTGATKAISGASVISIANVAVTGTYTNSGTLTVPTALSGAGGLINGDGTIGTLNLGGTSAITTLTATPSGNTVNYTGTGQSLKVIAYHHLILSGGAETFGAITTVAGNLTFSGTATATAAAALTIGGDIVIGSGTTFTGGAFTHNVAGDWTNNGGTFTSTGTTINFNNTTAGKAINGSAASQTFNNVSLNNTNQTLTAGSNLTIATLTSSSTSTLNMGTYTLTVTTATANAGKIYTQNTSGTPIPSGKTWGGTIIYNGASAQTAMAGIYNNLTISTTGGATLSGNTTVNGILNLAAANASATKGCLETGAYILTMGGSATTTGTGDVTGVVTRTYFLPGTPYTFGNQFTTLNLSSIGALSSLSVKIVLAVVPWTPTTNTVKRYYEIIQSGGTAATLVTMDLHYLDSELNSASENSLVIWDVHNQTSLHEHTSSSYNQDDNWVELGNLTLTYVAPASTFGATAGKYYGLADWTTTNHSVWFGGTTGGQWDLENNWTGGVPTATSDVIIPDAATTAFDPSIPATLTLKSLTIQSGGYLDGSSTTLTLTDNSGAWVNAGDFISGSGTLIFTGSAATMTDIPPPFVTYNNITVEANKKLTIESGSHIAIKGSLTLGLDAKLDAATNECTIEYNGTTAQTVINPNGSTPGYHNLILNNTLSLTLPSDTLYIRGDWTNNMSGITAPNVKFNGPYSMVQNIKGTQATTFTTLTINNSTGIVLTNVDVTVNTSLVLTSGTVTTGNNTVIITALGTVTRNGISSFGWVNGNMQKTAKIHATTTQTNIFEIGGTAYAPASILMKVTTGNTVILTAKATNGNPAAGSGINQLAKCNHYWTISKSGAGVFTSCSVKLTLTYTTNTGTIANYKVLEYEGSWSGPTTTYSANVLTATLAPTTSFGDFEVGELNPIIISTQPINTDICIGGNASFTAVSLSEPATSIQWQRDAGAGFEVIDEFMDGGMYPNSGSTILDISGATILLNNYQYQAVFTNTIGGIATSNAAILTVAPESYGGTLSGGGGNVCYGTNSTLLTLAGNIGLVTKWQSSTDGGALWTDIENITDTYTATNITASTMYHAVVQSGVCSSSNSNDQTINLSANTWIGAASGNWEVPGNWCGGVPTAVLDALIPIGKEVHITTEAPGFAECNNLSISSGGSLIVDAGKALTVYGTLTNGGSLTIKSNATGTGSLIHNTVGIAGTVERYITGWTGSLVEADHGWHFLSSPVAVQAISAFHTAGSGNDFYKWDEITNYWINRTASDGSLDGSFESNFVPGTGYLIANGSTTTPTFTGNLNVANIPVTGLTKTGAQTYTGWHLIGNPFSSALAWNNNDWNLNSIAANCEIWDEASASYFPAIIPPGNVIPAMNGFMVHADAAGASLTIPASARVHSSQAWYKNAQQTDDMIILIARDPAGQTAQRSVIRFSDDATEGYDTQYDNYFLSGFAPLFYTISQNENYILNTLPQSGKTATIPMGFVKNGSSQFSIELSQSIPGLSVYLTDQKSGTEHNLNDGNYAFTSLEGDTPERFQLHFKTLGIEDIEEATSDYSIYAADGIIHIKSLQQSAGIITVYDITGRTLAEGRVEAGASTEIGLHGISGVYIVRVNSRTGSTTAKVVIR